jgi:hypothetical protein
MMVEVRILSGAGEAADVGEGLDAVPGEELQEPVEWVGGMADGEEFRWHNGVQNASAQPVGSVPLTVLWCRRCLRHGRRSTLRIFTGGSRACSFAAPVWIARTTSIPLTTRPNAANPWRSGFRLPPKSSSG